MHGLSVQQQESNNGEKGVGEAESITRQVREVMVLVVVEGWGYF